MSLPKCWTPRERAIRRDFPLLLNFEQPLFKLVASGTVARMLMLAIASTKFFHIGAAVTTAARFWGRR
jgi:hypothetical protein